MKEPLEEGMWRSREPSESGHHEKQGQRGADVGGEMSKVGVMYERGGSVEEGGRR